MPERAGYTLVVYCLDVSPSMGDALPDPATGQKKAKLDLAKEFIARKCEPKVRLGAVSFRVALMTDFKWEKDGSGWCVVIWWK